MKAAPPMLCPCRRAAPARRAPSATTTNSASAGQYGIGCLPCTKRARRAGQRDAPVQLGDEGDIAPRPSRSCSTMLFHELETMSEPRRTFRPQLGDETVRLHAGGLELTCARSRTVRNGTWPTAAPADQ